MACAGYAEGNVFHMQPVLPTRNDQCVSKVISLSHLADVFVSCLEGTQGAAIAEAQRILRVLEESAEARTRPADLRGTYRCPRGYVEVWGTLGQEALRCVRQN